MSYQELLSRNLHQCGMNGLYMTDIYVQVSSDCQFFCFHITYTNLHAEKEVESSSTSFNYIYNVDRSYTVCWSNIKYPQPNTNAGARSSGLISAINENCNMFGILQIKDKGEGNYYRCKISPEFDLGYPTLHFLPLCNIIIIIIT